MYQVIKRDGKIVDFDINKIAAAIKKAFDAKGISIPYPQMDVHLPENTSNSDK